MKKTFIVLGIVVVGVIIYGVFFREQDINEAHVPVVTIVPVVDALDTQEHVFGATVKSANEAIVAAQISGTVKSITVNEGDRVARGQMIGSIDAGEYIAKYAQAQTAVRVAEEQEKFARRKWDELKPEERAQIKLDVDLVRAQLAESSAYLAKSRIVAPFEGVISSKFVSEGSSVVSGTPVLRVVGDNVKKEIVFDVSSEIGAMITEQDTVHVVRGDQETTATVYAVDPVADTQTRKVTVHAWMDDADLFELGAFVDVVVSTYTNGDEGSRIPVESLVRFYDDYRVFQIVDDHVVMIPVKVVQIDKNTVTVEGIEPGMDIVVGGAHTIRDGEQVKIVSQQK